MRLPIVAIDGPAGAGKSTVTRRVAETLGYLLVDTGALYRAAALAVQRKGIPLTDSAQIGSFIECLVEIQAIELTRGPQGASVLLSGEDVSALIRAPAVGLVASEVSAVPEVRAALLELQRAAGRSGGVVMEGRDIGTVVFPEAEVKFFLTANVEVRTQRRYAELRAKGAVTELASVRREVVERDQRDSTRPISPLRQAPDAIVIDSSTLNIDEVVQKIVGHVRESELRLSTTGLPRP